MFVNISHAHHAQIIVAPTCVARHERMADGRVLKRETDKRMQFVAIQYDIRTVTAGQFVLPVPPGTRLLDCDYPDLMLDMERLFPEPEDPASTSARRRPKAEIVAAPPRPVRDPPLRITGNWQYIVVEIEPDMQPAPIFYCHPLGEQLIVPTAASACGDVCGERAVTTRDINDRALQMLTRRQPLHARPYEVDCNWTVYVINAARVRHRTDLHDAGCELILADPELKFYENVDAARLPKQLFFGQIRSTYRLTNLKDNNVWLLL